MKRYRKILIALTGSPADHRALKWARLIAKPAQTERIEVLIIDPEPAAWVPEYPPLEDHEGWKDRVHTAAEEIAEVFQGLSDLALNTKACVGSALPTILQELVDADCDLVVVGVADEDDRRLAEKLARKSPASILSVPESANEHCEAILTPVDFSEPSALALEIANAIGRSLASKRITCLHSFRVSHREDRTGLPHESLVEAHLQSASDHLSGFLERHGSNSPPVDARVREAQIPSAAILDELQEHPCDLVVMATRGRNSLVRALLGSNTADVIRRASVPVLAVKTKGEGLPFLRAFLGIQEQHSGQPPAHSA